MYTYTFNVNIDTPCAFYAYGLTNAASSNQSNAIHFDHMTLFSFIPCHRGRILRVCTLCETMRRERVIILIYIIYCYYYYFDVLPNRTEPNRNRSFSSCKLLWTRNRMRGAVFTCPVCMVVCIRWWRWETIDIKQPIQNIRISCAYVWEFIYIITQFFFRLSLAYINTSVCEHIHKFKYIEWKMNVSSCIQFRFTLRISIWICIKFPCRFFFSLRFKCCFLFGISFGNCGNRDSFFAKKRQSVASNSIFKFISI